MASKNFAVTTVATAPSPATSGTSLVVAAGTGTRFPAAPFQATIWPTGANPTPLTAEVVTVTVVSTDTLTITRAQESSTARTVIIGDQIAATLTASMWAAPVFDGPVGIGVAAAGVAQLAVGGSLTNPSQGGLYISPSITTNVDASGGFVSVPFLTPSAPLSTLFGWRQWGFLNGTEGVTTPTIGVYHNVHSGFNSLSGYDAAITTLAMVTAANPSHAGGGTITNAYGFYSDINDAAARITNTRQLALLGNAPSVILGDLGLGVQPGGARLIVGGAQTNPSSGTLIVNPTITTNVDGTSVVSSNSTVILSAPVTNLFGLVQQVGLGGTEGVTTPTITNLYNVYSGVYTLAAYDANITTLALFHAQTPSHSGGGTITNLYGFYTGISTAARITNAWQIYAGGNAPSLIGGRLGIGGVPSTTGQLVVSGSVVDPVTGVLVVNTAVSAGSASDGMGVISSSAVVTPTAALTTLFGLQQWTLLDGVNAQTTFTIGTLNNVQSAINTLAGYDPAITTINMFNAGTPALAGAGTVTNLYGYYTAINSPMTGVTNPWQLYMGGTAPSAFLGKVSIGIGVVQAANYLYVNRTSTGSDGIVSMAAFELTTTSSSGALDQGAMIAVMRMQDTARGAVRAGEFELLRWDDTGTGTAVVGEFGIHNHRVLVSFADNPAVNDNFYGTGGILMYNVTSGEIGSGSVSPANFGLLIRNSAGRILHPLLVYGPSDRKILDLNEWGHLMVDYVDTVHGQLRSYEMVNSAAATLQLVTGAIRTITSAVAATNVKNARGEWLRISATVNNADANLVGAFTVTQRQASPIFTTRVEIPTAKVNMRVMIGLFSAGAVLTTDTQNTIHSAYFRFSTGASDTTWQCCTSNATSTTVATLLYAPTLAVDTVYLLKIDFTDQSNVRFYINGVLAAVATATLPTATTSMGPSHYLRSLSASVQKDLDTAYMSIWQ